ncbi:MAG: AMIN domain-containing protein, partial [Desulfobacterales bacterium]|nr:AMIN domain-containing protein [Desulfobacterales bacterium]
MMGLLLLLAGCATGPSTQQDPKAEETSGITTVEQLATVSRPESAEIQIQTSGEVDYTSVKQLEPLGVIFYFPQAQLGDLDRQYQPEDEAIDAVLLSSSQDRRNVRVEVHLARDMNYTVDKQATGLIIRFDKKDLPEAREPEAAIQPPARTEENNRPSRSAQSFADRQSGPEAKTDTSRPKQTKEVYKDIATVKDIHFASGESGASVVTIRTSRPVNYDLTRSRDQLLKLKLTQSALPDHADRRPLITTRFDSAVDRVIPYAVPDKKDLVEMIIELREAVPYRVEQEGRELMIHFEASSVGPRPYPVADLPEWQQVLEEVLTEEAIAEAGLSNRAEAAKKAEKQVEWLFEKEEYTGEKIALDFYETDIKNVFRILQQISGKNYAIDPDVQGKVTINMEKPVPWDQVLDLILKQNRLGKVERDEIIRIATLETLRQEEEARRQRIAAYKNRIEQEKAMEPLVTEYIPISYASAQGEVLPHIEDVLSDRGKVNVDNRNNQLIITDTMERIDKAQEVISKIDKVTPQVEI